MQITKTAIKRGVTFLMIYSIVVGFGLFSLGRLRIDLFPNLTFPMIAILTQYTGVGPYDIESTISRPLEEAVASVQNINTISSTSSQGFSLIMLEFNWGTDMDQAEIDVRTYLDFVENYLPDDASDPMVFAFDISMQPVAFYSIGSDIHDLAELRRICELELEPRIERISGVASASTTGGLQREIQILVDPVRLKAYNISIQQVETALMMNNLQLPAGWIEDKQREFTVQTIGEYQSIEEIENTAIMSMGESVIHIKDVADVVDGFVEQRAQVWTNNKPAVIMTVQRQSDANTVNVSREINKAMPQIISELPRGIEIETVYDQADFINRSITNLGSTAIEAILLAVLVLFFFLRNVRSSFIIAISIPISMIVTFAVMDQVGLTLNIISMAGLALAVGLLVDNSIVVLESIFRHQEDEKDQRMAADIGTQEVAMAITASTLTTVSVFVPVLFVPGIAGVLFKEMVLTICFSLAASLLVALTLVPLLASRILKVAKQIGKQSRIQQFGNRIGEWIDNLRVNYIKALDWSLHHRKIVILSTLGLLIISSVLLYTRGGEFIPESDTGFLQMTIDRSAGTSLSAMEESVKALNEIIEEVIPDAEMNYTNFGQGEGIYAVFSTSSSNQGDVMVRLKPKSERQKSLDEIEAELTGRVKELPDMDVAFADRGEALFMGGGGDIVVEIFGHDLEVSKALANQIVEMIEPVEGVSSTEISIRESSPELKINLDRQRIADLGLSTTQVGQVISTSMLGSVVTRYREEGEEYNIRVQLKKDARESKTDIENILIMTPLQRQIPLRAIATVEYGESPGIISREDQERVVTVAVSVSGRDLRSTTNDVRNTLKDLSIPLNFRLNIGGSAEDMMESFTYLGIAFLVAMVLVYMVMASQFESLVDPFIILFTIPLSIIGVALALFFTGTDLSVMSLIGIIMLVGIIVNNGIVLVDYINQLRERGHGLMEAIRLGGEARMRPVLMTALTTILAMFPLSLGLGESGENWAPMARSVIGGLLVGTALTLIVVPVIYLMVENFSTKMKTRRAARAAKSA
ncbi:efflux RND transporter permease subunit [bacterium]|nr:efflux RND transporter permease subunit [bacterium]